MMDDIITEPLGGAHAEPMGSFPAIKQSIMDIYYTKRVPPLLHTPPPS